MPENVKEVKSPDGKEHPDPQDRKVQEALFLVIRSEITGAFSPPYPIPPCK